MTQHDRGEFQMTDTTPATGTDPMSARQTGSVSRGNDRAEAFLADVARIRVHNAPSDRLKCWLGALLMAAGGVTCIVAYVKSATSDSLLVQNDAQVLVVIGLTAAVIGCAVFLRYSVGEFLRFWLARALLRDAGQDD
jgi:hypothetical protein